MKLFKTLFVFCFITNSFLHAQVVTDPWADMGGQARDMAIDAAGNVYTANFGNSTVSKITPSGTLTLAWATLASGTGPAFIAIDALGNVYTANNNSTISKINSTGTVTQSWSFTGQARGLVIDGSNNIYSSNYTNSTVMKISAGGTLTNPWVSLASGTAPFHIAIDASGNIYTPNYNNANGTVSKITPSGSLTQTYASITSAPGGYPTFIHVDRFGNLYGATTNYTVFKITPAGALTDPWATLTPAGGNQQSLVTDVLGNVYAVTYGSLIVSKITPSGTVTASWVTLTPQQTGIKFPRRIVIDSTGNLYIVISNPANANLGYVSKIALGVLPLKLVALTATSTTNKVGINWQSANEVNLSHFTIQRSVDGNNFIDIGNATAKGDGGYSFTDNQLPNASVVYYRLQMVDKDGSNTYSKVVAVLLKNSHTQLTIFPNPVKETLFVQLASTKAEKITLQITDMQGKVLQQQIDEVGVGNTSLSISTATLAKGSYVLLVKSGEALQQKQFVKE